MRSMVPADAHSTCQAVAACTLQPTKPWKKRCTTFTRTGKRFSSTQCARWPTFARRFCSAMRSEEHTSELQSLTNLVCRLLLEKKKDDHQALSHEDLTATAVPK